MPELSLTLPYDVRKKSRFRAELDGGSEVAVILPRGGVLRDGDLLEADTGEVVEVHAAPERVSEVRTSDSLLLARACYHLGNRHVPLEIGIGWVRYEHDHVLDEMVVGLGLSVCCRAIPFEPETGAYGGGHSSSHSHPHPPGDSQ